MTDYPLTLKYILSSQTRTIERHRVAGESVWVRKTGKQIPQWRYTLLGLLAKRLNLGALQPVPNHGGQTALRTEAARLQSLGEAGVRVPQLLAESDDGIMFSHLGDETLLSRIENHPDRLQYWQQGLAAIADVHARGQYLSQAFARNIIVQSHGGIGFIDFEDDPGQYLSLSRCHSRDYLCYLQSTCLWLKKYGLLAEAAAIWQQHAATLSPKTAAHTRAAVRPMLWMRHLHWRRWGSDTLRLAALAGLFFLSQNQ